MRVVLDANVLVSAVISTVGPSREIVAAWTDGRFELIASPALLEELRDVLARPRLRKWVSVASATEFVSGLTQDASVLDDPPPLAGVSPDPDDDYLVALARAARAEYLVSGDRHQLDIPDPRPPVLVTWIQGVVTLLTPQEHLGDEMQQQLIRNFILPSVLRV